jgi:hypothetical protein
MNPKLAEAETNLASKFKDLMSKRTEIQKEIIKQEK